MKVAYKEFQLDFISPPTANKDRVKDSIQAYKEAKNQVRVTNEGYLKRMNCIEKIVYAILGALGLSDKSKDSFVELAYRRLVYLKSQTGTHKKEFLAFQKAHEQELKPSWFDRFFILHKMDEVAPPKARSRPHSRPHSSSGRLESVHLNMSRDKPEQIISFYKGEGAINVEGNWYKFDELLAKCSDQELEQCHGHIQMLFPTRTPSQFIAKAPYLQSANLVAQFKSIPDVQNKMRKAFHRMMQFYGFEDKGGGKVKPAERRLSWMAPGDHNQNRITRILKSLEMMDLYDEASALREAIRGTRALDHHPSRSVHWGV